MTVIDLLIVGDLSLKEMAAILGPIGRDLGREINPVFYKPAEFRQRIRKGDHFIKEVLEGPKIYLIGNERELASLQG